MKQYYKIAGLTVEMESFGKTVEQAAAYITEPCDEADIVIQSYWQAMKSKAPELSDESCEYISTGTSFYRQLIGFGGIMIHSSAVVVDDVAYLFTAPCGTGKSTHTALWLSEFDGAYILNDDKPAIRIEEGGVFAYGTPWSGKTAQNVDKRVRLGGICLLSRGEKNEICRIGGKEAIFAILSQTLRPRDAESINQVLSLIEKIISAVPVWSLKCNMESEAAHVSFDAMSEAAREAFGTN